MNNRVQIKQCPIQASERTLSSTHMIQSLHEISKFSDTFCCDTLLMIDVDEVLITAEDVVLRPHADSIRNKVFDQLVREFQLDNNALDLERIKSKTFTEPTRRPVEQDVAAIVQSLQKLPCKVMAATACHTGALGELKNFEEWRYRQLLNLGIDFTQKAPFSENLLLREFDNFSNPPTYYRGILFTSIRPKGLVLRYFLERIQWMPKQIILVDDVLKNIESVASIAKDLQLPFLGLHYVNQVLESEKGSEVLWVHAQLRYLIERGHWLSQKKT